MILKMFSVFDSKAGVFAQPFFTHNNLTATREFADSVNNPESRFNKHPEDFTLFACGEYDDTKGLVIPLHTPQSLGLAAEFIRREH